MNQATLFEEPQKTNVLMAPAERLVSKSSHGGMGSHQSARMMKDEWLTPPEILSSLGKFDLDPCSPVSRPWDTARTHYNIYDNGLIQPWFSRVWLNPPYSKVTDFMKKMSAHNNGIAFIYTRVETRMFFDYVWDKADAVFFFKGCIKCILGCILEGITL